MNAKRLFTVVFLACAVTTGALVGSAVAESESKAAYTGDRLEVERFMEAYEAIELTPAQEAIRVDALDDLPAACCKEFSAATCCCECNLSRATWGLAKHLIAEEGADAATVRREVEAFWAKLGPADGWSGEVCTTGGCGRPMKHDGCGGMSPHHLAVD